MLFSKYSKSIILTTTNLKKKTQQKCISKSMCTNTTSIIINKNKIKTILEFKNKTHETKYEGT
jgi:hypothetical protein